MYKLNPIFSPSRMEKFTLKAGSMFLSETFQFIIAEKCNIQSIFYNLAGPICLCYQVNSN